MRVTESEDIDRESEETSDDDIYDEEEINKVFNLKCERITKEIVNKDKYILHIDATTNTTPNIVIGLSDNVIEVYNFSNNRLAKLHSLELPENVAGVKASMENENLFYVGSKNCEIRILDLRDKNCRITFKDTTVENELNYKPLNCFDVASNNLLLSGGTDLHYGDAYTLFWDVRNTKLLGAYWDSHKDDITQVVFHPDDSDKLISGSTDGLINIFDLSKTSEDDALIDSLNTESSVQQLNWYSHNNIDTISCITHTNDIQLWKSDDGEPYVHFRREDIAKKLLRKLESYCYVASTHINRNSKLMTLVGSNYGNGECLRSFGIDNKNLQPLFDVKGNKQRVRSTWLNKNGDILVTGGESGVLDVWHVETNFATSSKRKK